MRKGLAVILSLLLCFCMACGSSNEAKAEEPQEKAVETPNDKPTESPTETPTIAEKTKSKEEAWNEYVDYLKTFDYESQGYTIEKLQDDSFMGFVTLFYPAYHSNTLSNEAEDFAVYMGMMYHYYDENTYARSMAELGLEAMEILYKKGDSQEYYDKMDELLNLYELVTECSIEDETGKTDVKLLETPYMTLYYHFAEEISGNEVIYLYVDNKTDTTLTCSIDSIALDGYTYSTAVGQEHIAPMSKGRLPVITLESEIRLCPHEFSGSISICDSDREIDETYDFYKFDY